MKSAKSLPNGVPEIELVPTFECISYYFNFDSAVESATILWAEKSLNPDWKETIDPVISEEIIWHNNPPAPKETYYQVRGSLVNLKQNTSYTVRCTIMQNGSPIQLPDEEATTYADTNKLEDENKVEEFDLSDKLKNVLSLDVNKIGYLEIDNMNGTNTNWYKIIADQGFSIDYYDSSVYVSIYYDAQIGEYTVKTLGGRPNPNGIYCHHSSHLVLDGFEVKGGEKSGIFVFDSQAIRLSNLEVHQFGEKGNLLPSGKIVRPDGTGISSVSMLITDSVNITVERCYIHNPVGTSNPWRGDTWTSREPDGVGGITVTRGNNIIIRYNSIVGNRDHSFADGIHGSPNLSPIGGMATDSDVYGNFIFHGEDDGLELDGGQRNVRMFGNRIEGFYSCLSLQGTMIGPSYSYRNILTNVMDTSGNAAEVIKIGARSYYHIETGNLITGGEYDKLSPEEKANYTSTNFGKAFLFNNTVYSKESAFLWTTAEATGSRVVSRNNIYITEKSTPVFNNLNSSAVAEQALQALGFSVENDLVFNKQDPSLITFPPRHSIFPESMFKALPSFVDEEVQDFHLQLGSFGIDAGEDITNFILYAGNKPDLGALEFENSFAPTPLREIDVSVDKYSLRVAEGDTHIITLRSAIAEDVKFNIRSDDDWYSTTINGQTEGTLLAFGSMNIQVQINSVIIGEVCKGAFLVQMFVPSLNKTCTIPVTLFFERPLRKPIQGNLIIENIDAITRQNIPDGNSEFKLYKYENLIKNGKFESNEYWTLYNYYSLGVKTQGNIHFVTAAYSLNGGYVFQNVYLEQGVTYYATAKIRNTAPPDGAPLVNRESRLQVRFQLHGFPSSQTNYDAVENSNYDVINHQGWTDVKLQYTPSVSGVYIVRWLKARDGLASPQADIQIDITDVGLYAENKISLVDVKRVSNAGTLLFENIEEGKYKLIQSIAPAGYQIEAFHRILVWPSARVYFANDQL